MIIMTTELAHAAATDAANRTMRENGRSRWGDEEHDAFVAEIDRLAPYVPGWTPENPLQCGRVEERRTA